MKKILSITVLLALVMSAYGQEKHKFYVPEKGDWSVGVTFNPATMGRNISMQPKAGEFAGEWIGELASSPKQMFILSQDPLAAVKAKYFVSKKMALRATLGLNGSLVNYKEYVRDDLAASIDPDTENKVVDNVRSNLNSVSLQIGLEGRKGEGCVRFVYGFDIMYTLAGGRMKFDYGNALTDLNRVPSSMPMTSEMKEGSVNDFQSKLGIDYGRPVERYNSGYIHGIGLSVDMGIEVYLAERISLGVAMNFTPVMFTFQPQTYTIYEGFSSFSGKVEQYNALVSPGSNALLYGTENIGCRISLNYYF
ncbi:MAG: hypothetical protein ACI39U_03240 [Candidatus Cryptobacteroides sp.]